MNNDKLTKEQQQAGFVDESRTLRFKKLGDDAVLPTKAHATDSGFDLYAAEDVIIGPTKKAIVSTQVAVDLPEGYEAQVRPRSGITANTNLQVHLGTIDNGYTGDIGIIVENTKPVFHSGVSIVGDNSADIAYTAPQFKLLMNTKDEYEETDEYYPVGTYIIRKGDKIAQLVVQKLPKFDTAVFLDGDIEKDRGDKGFGSSGV